MITKDELYHLNIKNPVNCKYPSFLKYFGKKRDILPNILILDRK